MPAEKTAEEQPKRRWWQRGGSQAQTMAPVEEKGVTHSKGRVTPGRRNTTSAEPTGNVVTRPLGAVVEYFEGVQSEIKKVTWPTRDDTRRLTVIVLVTTLIASLVLGLISLGFTELFRFGLNAPLIFVVFFIVAGIVGFFIYRRTTGGSNISPY